MSAAPPSDGGHRVRRAVKGVAWTAAEVWTRQLLQAASFVILARLLGPEAWGLVGIALIFTVAGTSLLTETGWVPALVRAQDLSGETLDTVFWTALGAAALCCPAGACSGLDRPVVR